MGVYAFVTAGFEGMIGSMAAYTGTDPGGLPVERILFTAIVYLPVFFGGAVYIRKLFDLIQERAELPLENNGEQRRP
jgi:hypothetical protein